MQNVFISNFGALHPRCKLPIHMYVLFIILIVAHYGWTTGHHLFTTLHLFAVSVKQQYTVPLRFIIDFCVLSFKISISIYSTCFECNHHNFAVTMLRTILRCRQKIVTLDLIKSVLFLQSLENVVLY